jgi:uncharacterized membrane protein YkvA (DUF1232 family)
MSEPDEKRSPAKSFVMAVLALVSTIYLFNPTAGFLELIPDNLPFFGNLDEAAAATILVSCLAYFGFDITKVFGAKKDKEKTVDGKVVDE